MRRLAMRHLLTLSVIGGALGPGATAEANCEAPPPAPVECFCNELQLDVVYLGHLETVRVPGRRTVSLDVEEVKTRDEAVADYAPGDVLVIDDVELTNDSAATASTVVDGQRSLVWPVGGESFGVLTAPEEGLSFVVERAGAWTDYEGEPICATPVAPETVAAVLVAHNCYQALRELAPQVPPRPSYYCNDNPGACGGAGAGAPWLPGAVLAALLVALLRRRQKTRTPAKKLGKKWEDQPGAPVALSSTSRGRGRS